MRPNLPEEKQNPKHNLVIRGEKPSDINLRIRLGYATTNDACRKNNYIEGAHIPRQLKDTRLILAGTNQFNINFYLDKYIPGRCGWVAQNIYYGVDNSKDKHFHGSWYLLGQIEKNKDQQTISHHFLCKDIDHNILCTYKDNPRFSNPVPGISSSGGEMILKFDTQ